ncbi:type IV secretory pathway TraG/TraD family ATPase VirD4 [Microbacterium terrae]|nr:type IV secretory pathway TraG/TraD family ATPase VirD4 [Microbacterium terrae]GLJ97222.1 hypothetical protein GCM10017594_04190 [Microbacterium terrae]
MGDELTNLGLIILVVGVVVLLILRGAASVAAWITGAPPPTGAIESGFGILTSPGTPGAIVGSPTLSTVAYWICACLLLGGASAIGAGIWFAIRHIGGRTDAAVERTPGIATRADVVAFASRKALLRRARHLRPSLERPKAIDAGYLLGHAHSTPVWASVEDSVLVIGPPRSGKGLHVVINAILDAPGAVVTTSTRPDNLTATMQARSRVGPVAVFDPQELAGGLAAGLRWSTIRGCDDPLTAMIRAAGLASGTGLGAGGVESGGFWEAKTRTALQTLLHAAAIGNRSPSDLFRWTLDPSEAADAVAILVNDARAATGWADSLRAMLDSDPRTRDSIWQGVSLALGALADPRVLRAVSPPEGEEFDPEAFLRGNGTLYLLATGAGANNSAALVAAFVEDLVECARRMAARSPGARLDPPLLLALDEIGNLAPLPSLPTLMAEGGGTGMTTMPVLQSLAQARAKWNDNGAGAIWDASIVKIILGGASNSRDLQDLSTLIGDRDEATDSTTVGDRGSRSSQRSVRRVAILPPDTIRRLPFGTGLVMLRSAPPIVTRLRPWTSRTDAAALRSDRAEVEERLRRGSPAAVDPGD